MRLATFLTGAAIAGVVALSAAPVASAQVCEETQFTSAAGQLYLDAETEILVNENPQAALAKLNQLRAMELNCYERGAVLRLGAAVKIQAGDMSGAVADLESALAQGFIPEAERPTTYFNIYQIYLSDGDLQKAVEYAERWIAAGGRPDRDQKWTLSIVYHRADDNATALRLAEEVFANDGPNAAREVYDFLIFLYDETGNLAKKAELLEQLLIRNPTERRLWDAIAGDYYQANEERKAFEVQKAMYLGGILQTEDELMRIVNFYNRFDAPYEGARVLEKEMNAGRIETTFDKLELLANLYQVAREYEKAIPVIERAAQLNNSGEMYERLGRSYAELQDWENAEEALQRALQVGGVKDRGLAWVLIGQSRYERDDRSGAREAFRNANNRGGRGWLSFMQSEDETERALVRFGIQTRVLELENEDRACTQLRVLGGENMPDGCGDVRDRLGAAREELADFDA
ncbi:MAG: hypothetical protein AAFX03_05115 [Pseudomonadota bacterium]